MPQLFTDLGQKLIQYKNASILDRKKILEAAINTLEALPEKEKVTGKDSAKNHFKELSYAATLINYANVLQRMENQDYFDILVDFYKMELSDELKKCFEFGKAFGQMKLKKPINEFTPEIWSQFREAQKAHLLKTSKTHLFNLDQLDINNPPADQLYPIQIQMGGKLQNEAVDRIHADPQGRIRFASRFGLYLLPGGGMVEISDTAKIDDHKRKMLEEHLEEEHANLYQKAASLYDGLATKEFYEALEKVSSGKEFKSMPDEFKKFYDDTVQ
ncbi:MAG: hypothetical protein ACHQ1D_08735, partial [Nitrososphaerales archaeon]